jgi:serine/threonine protein kinase
MSQEFRREYLLRLPLPLAQLYGRAHNARDARGRHDNTFYLFEALIKLAAAPAIACYQDEARRGVRRDESPDRLLAQLALPTLGHWAATLRELARYFGQRPDAAEHPLGHLWGQLARPLRDRPGLLALYQRIKNGPDGAPAADQSCTLLGLIDSLVSYRNAVFGHGAGRPESYYERDVGPLLFRAANDILAEGLLDVLGPRGSRLVYLSEPRPLGEGRVEVGLRDLVGLHGAPLTPLPLSAGQAAGLRLPCVAVLWPGRPLPLPLTPLLLYRTGEAGEEVLFLLRDRNGREVEYTSYTTGRSERDRVMAPLLAAFLGRAAGPGAGAPPAPPPPETATGPAPAAPTPSPPAGPAPVSREFQREYLLRLPLPLAQLYSRAFNDKTPRGRHANAFFLLEALIKLMAAPAVMAYAQEAEQGGPRGGALDELLAQLALPSLGSWVSILRELARHFGTRPGAASHPLGRLYDRLNRPCRDPSALLTLYRRIKGGPDGAPAADRSCTPLQVIEALVRYRNIVIGHGAPGTQALYEQEVGPLLLPAANELLSEATFSVPGPPDSRLVYLSELRSLGEGRVEVGLRDLVGLQSERLSPLLLSAAEAAGLAPGRVAILWPGRAVPLRLDPLLAYREGDLAEELLFLNRDRAGRQVEYLSYTTGRTERDRTMAPALAALLGRMTGRQVAADQLHALAEEGPAEAPPAEAPAARQLGDYELLAEIGRGALSVVYLARQLSLGRLVALKMLPADLAGDATALGRFRREVEALAGCDHPNIVKVLSSGAMPDGRVYCATEYVPGCTLEQVWRELAATGDGTARPGPGAWGAAVSAACQKQRQRLAAQTAGAGSPLPETPSGPPAEGDYVRQVIALMRDAALALQAVHDRGLVHRDVKPSNFIVTPDGARVVLMDFGTVLAGAETATTEHGFVGTLRYAAPEQLAAGALPVGPAADVHGLGITLWELLTRRRLFAEAQDERQLAAMVLDQEVPRLRQVDPTADADLEAIVLRATERRVADRIPDAGRLAHYLQSYLDGRPVPLRAPRFAEMARRWARRNPLPAALFTALVVTVVLGLAAAVQLARASAERDALRGQLDEVRTLLRERDGDVPAGADAARAAAAGDAAVFGLVGWVVAGFLLLLATALGVLYFLRRRSDGAARQARQAARGVAGDADDLDTAAEEHAFSSQTVVVHYPAPIAVAYQRLSQQRDDRKRVEALMYVVEATLRDLLDGLARAGGAGAALPAHRAFDFLRVPTKMSLGDWLDALRETARELRRKKGRYVRELPEVFRPGGELDDRIGQLVSERNKAIHQTGSLGLSDAECQEILGEARPLLEQVLYEVRFVRSYALGFLQVSPGVGGSAEYRYSLYSCMGARLPQRTGVFTSPVKLQEHYPFVAAAGGGLLYLWPLLAFLQGDHGPQRSLFAFEAVADEHRPFLTAVRYAALYWRDPLTRVLHPEPATSHGWLLDRLRALPGGAGAGAKVNLARGLRRPHGPKLLGKTLGPYYLRGLIATGGFGTIYDACGEQGQAAVKVLESRDQGLSDEDLEQQFRRFRQEFDKLEAVWQKIEGWPGAGAGAGGDRPGIIRCYTWGETPVEGELYYWYSMEFAAGGDLSRRIEERRRQAGSHRVPWRLGALRGQIVHEFEEVLAAVAFLHGLDIIHRDIKPSNVLIMGTDGTLRLSDFGLVKNLKPSLQTRVHGPGTMRGAVQGTWHYMAPEQKKAEPTLDKRADVYSLGVLLAELATGRLPPLARLRPPAPAKAPPDPEAEGGTTLEQSAKTLAQLPKALRKFIFRCTDRDPARRPEDARAVKQEFAELVSSLPA